MNEYCGDKNIGEKFVIKNIIKEIYYKNKKECRCSIKLCLIKLRVQE